MHFSEVNSYEDWMSFDRKDKKSILQSTLKKIVELEKSKKVTKNRKEFSQICLLKKKMEDFILKIYEWEK